MRYVQDRSTRTRCIIPPRTRNNVSLVHGIVYRVLIGVLCIILAAPNRTRYSRS